jgi:hypothetical protein
MEHPLGRHIEENEQTKEILGRWLVRDWRTSDAAFLLAGLEPKQNPFSSEQLLLGLSPKKRSNLTREQYYSLLRYAENIALALDDFPSDVFSYSDFASPEHYIEDAKHIGVEIPWSVTEDQLQKPLLDYDFDFGFIHYPYSDASSFLQMENWTVCQGLLMLADISPNSSYTSIIRDYGEFKIYVNQLVPLDVQLTKNSSTEYWLELANEYRERVGISEEMDIEQNTLRELKAKRREYRHNSSEPSAMLVSRSIQARLKKLETITHLWNALDHPRNDYPKGFFVQWADHNGISPKWVDWATRERLLN